MGTIEVNGLSNEVLVKNQAAFEELNRRYRTDAAFRSAVDAEPEARLREIGMLIPPNMSVRVAADTDGVMHVVMPPDPNIDLADEALEMVAGGDTMSSAGTAGTMSSALSSTMVSTAGTAGSASTAASN